MRRSIANPPCLLAAFVATALILAAAGNGVAHADPATTRSSSLSGLEADLAAAIESSGLDVTVAVTDLQTGETISVRGEDPRLAACTMNLLVLLQATVDMSNGLIPYATGDELIGDTIYGSNPVPARELLFLIGNGDLFAGMNRVNALARTLDLDLFYDHPPAFGEESLTGIDNWVTAAEMNKLLSAIWQQRVLDEEWTGYLLKKMINVKPGLQYLIPAGVSNGVVSHKNGFVWTALGWADNDLGIVRFQSGGQTYAYAISYYANWVPVEYGDIVLGQRISRLTWSYFQDAYAGQ